MEKKSKLLVIISIAIIFNIYLFSYLFERKMEKKVLGESSSSVSVGLYVGSSGSVTVNAPSNLNLEVQSDSQIKITWNDNSSNEDGFVIERKKEGDSFEVIKTISASSTSYTDDNLDPETQYSYRVRGYAGSVYSDYSSEKSATTEISEINIDSIEGTCDSLDVKVSTSSYYSGKDLDFRIKIKNVETGSENETDFNNTNANSDGGSSLTISSLDQNSQFKVSVRFKYNNDYSDWSNEETIETSGCEVAIITPPTLTCTGSIPSGSTMCSGDNESLTSTLDWLNIGTSSAGCTISRKCEYYIPLVVSPVVLPLVVPSPVVTTPIVNNKIVKEKKEIGIIPSVVNERIEEVRQVVQENQPAMTTTSLTSLAVSSVALASQLPSLAYLGAFSRSVWAFLSGIFIRRKKVWGVVFDNITGMPIAFAAVSIFNKDDRKVDSRITDSHGAYSFLVSPGEYRLEIDRKGYEFNPRKEGNIFYHDQYSGEKISAKEYDIIKKDIPMSQNSSTYQKAVQTFKIKKFLSYIFLLGGMVFSFGVLAFDQSPINWIICLIYLGSILISYGMAGGKKWGTILNQFKKPEPFATIKVFDKETETLKARTISDEKGRYFLILDPGRYDVKVNTVSGVEKNEEILLKDRMAFKDNISLVNN